MLVEAGLDESGEPASSRCAVSLLQRLLGGKAAREGGREVEAMEWISTVSST
jgi:hypothetical protein